MTSNRSKPITVILSMEKIKGFITSLPELNGPLEEKRKMAFAAVEHLDTYFGGELGENDTCTNKPTLPGIGDIEPCFDKPRIPDAF